MRIHGRHGSIELRDGVPPGPAVVLGSLNHWTLNMTRDYADVTAYEDDNKIYVPGPRDTAGTIAGFYDMEATGASPSEPLFDAAEGDAPVKLALIPNSLDATHFWEGLAYLDVSIDVAANGAVTLSGGFKAGGPWTRSGAGTLLSRGPDRKAA
jgi:hypothetical protein